MTEADVNTVTTYLDNPRYWPEPTGGSSLASDAGTDLRYGDAGGDAAR